MDHRHGRFDVTERVGLLGLLLGVLGLATGVVAALIGAPALAPVAGVLALGAGGVSRHLATARPAPLADPTPEPSRTPRPSPASEADEQSTSPRDRRAGAATSIPDIPEAVPPPASGGAERPAEQTRPDGDGSIERRAIPPIPGEPGPAGSGLSPTDGWQEPNGNALVDSQTGLFSQDFFQVALDSRIAAARRHLRPVAMALIDVVRGLPANDPVPVDAGFVAETLKTTLREADTACRLENGYFAILLEDTPENGAIWTIERIRRQLGEAENGLTVWAGIACYPAHAFSPDRLLEAAEAALIAARDWRQDRIEIASAAE
jgi:two-component system cell cycle response regulator